MRAAVISEYGAPEVLVHTEVPDPVAGPGDVLIRVEAFGLNHAELYMRSGVWGDVAKIPGIEAVGTVAADPGGRLAAGTPVVTLMGGLGRVRDGSYAELVRAAATNVVPVETGLSWPELAAIPEVYAATWSGLHGNLGIQAGQTLLVRGATSAMGQAAVNIAVDAGLAVLATTRDPARAALLRTLGAADVLIEDGALTAQLSGRGTPVDALLDLVGNSTLRDSLTAVRPGGRVAQMGFLGGQASVESFNPIADLPTGVQLSFFGSFVLGTEAFPVPAIPIAELVAKAEAGTFRARPARVYGFDDVVQAHRDMEANAIGGKAVVVMR